MIKSCHRNIFRFFISSTISSSTEVQPSGSQTDPGELHYYKDTGAAVVSRSRRGRRDLTSTLQDRVNSEYFISTKTMTQGQANRIKSGNFGHQVNSDSDLVCFLF